MFQNSTASSVAPAGVAELTTAQLDAVHGGASPIAVLGGAVLGLTAVGGLLSVVEAGLTATKAGVSATMS
jgi:lactobin A/cerein 7B family class IIb bacteriocin